MMCFTRSTAVQWSGAVGGKGQCCERCVMSECGLTRTPSRHDPAQRPSTATTTAPHRDAAPVTAYSRQLMTFMSLWVARLPTLRCGSGGGGGGGEIEVGGSE